MGIKRKIIEVFTEDRPVSNEIHPSRKVRLEYGEQNTRLAKIYNDLSDEYAKVRLTAAASLIRALQDIDPGELSRAFDRLVKGLCSGRKAARSGFFIALTEFLSLIVARDLAEHSEHSLSVSTSNILPRIVALTEAEGNVSKREKRDHALGRCLALNSIIKSNYLSKTNATFWHQVLDQLMQLSSQSPLLQRECGAILQESVLSMSVEDPMHSERILTLIRTLNNAKLLKNAEGLAIWLSARERFPQIHLPTGIWHNQDPLCAKERSVVAGILRGSGEISTSESVEPVNKNNGSPQTVPSFAWPVVLKMLFRRVDDDDSRPGFISFWKEAIDEGHFSTKASTERKALGLQILSIAIKSAPSSLISDDLFSTNLMRCIINHRSNAASNLQQLAQVPLNGLVARAKTDPEIVYQAISALMLHNGAVNFDQLTKSKTVEKLLSHAEGKTIKKLLKLFRSLIHSPPPSDHISPETSQRIVADLLLNMARRQVSVTEEQALGQFQRCLEILAEAGFVSSPSDIDSSKLSKGTQELLRNRTMSGLGQLLKARTDPSHELTYQITSQVYIWSKEKGRSFTFDADSQICQALEDAMQNLHGVQRKCAKSKKLDQKKMACGLAIKLLYSLSILQALGGDVDAISLLNDLDLCFKAWLESDNPTVMLIEILLSFLSRPSAIYRNLAEQVFAAFAPDMTEDGFDSMLDILQKKENLSGQQELFDANEDQEDGDDASDVVMSDVEASDDESHKSDESEDSTSDEESSTSQNEAESVDDDTRAFETKLAQTLGASGATEQNGEEASSESDGSDMDDDRMMELEGHLTTIFKERAKQTSKKQDSKDAKANIINFKNRVLDMFGIYVKQEHANVLVLGLIIPLLDVIRTTSSKQTSEKAFGVLKQLFDACNKSKQMPSTGGELAFETLKAIHGQMGLKASKLHKSACSRAGLFLAKTLVTARVENFDSVSKMYCKLQRKWYEDPASTVLGSVFTEWTSWCIATRKTRAGVSL